MTTSSRGPGRSRSGEACRAPDVPRHATRLQSAPGAPTFRSMYGTAERAPSDGPTGSGMLRAVDSALGEPARALRFETSEPARAVKQMSLMYGPHSVHVP